ncbi:MAG: manganese efflux pump MntP family protein [Acidobacteriota bacterium]
METIETALVAVALGCDAFAVGMGVGTRFCTPRQVFRLSFHFGLFQFLMPLIGCFLGQNVVGLAHRWGPWIAFVVLFVIGAKMAYESFHHEEDAEESQVCPDPTRGFRLVGLSVATSIDALGVGFSIGLLGQGLFLSAVWIGITAGAMTWTAMKLGNNLSEKFGSRMEILGGLILMGIAVKLII